MFIKLYSVDCNAAIGRCHTTVVYDRLRRYERSWLCESPSLLNVGIYFNIAKLSFLWGTRLHQVRLLKYFRYILAELSGKIRPASPRQLFIPGNIHFPLQFQVQTMQFSITIILFGLTGIRIDNIRTHFLHRGGSVE